MGKMNQDVKAKWLEALRSGDYEQGNSFLRTDGDQFCCLGVLCDLAVKEGVIPVPAVSRGVYVYGEEGDGAYAESAGLPQAVIGWSGVSVLGNLPDGYSGAIRSLSGLNDTGTNFPTIADIIEKEL